MRLPYLPYSDSPRTISFSTFGGLDTTENAAGGKYTSCRNMSLDNYPALAPREGRTLHKQFQAPSNVFAWDGGLVVVDGTTVYYNDRAVGTCTVGKKQFAVVNTKLCIFPDAIYIDLTTSKMGRFRASATSVAGFDATISANSITLPSTKIYEDGQFLVYTTYMSAPYTPGARYYVCKTYSNVEWTGSEWILEGEEETEFNLFNGTGRYIMLKYNEVEGVYQPNLKQVFRNTTTNPPTIEIEHDYEDVGYDSRGFYGRLTRYEYFMSDGYAGAQTTYGYGHFDVLNYDVEQQLSIVDLSGLFKAGDRVNITGCTNAANNIKRKKIKSVSKTTVTFEEDVLTAGTDSAAITIETAFPHLDYVCESNNRLWGVSNEQESEIWDAMTESYTTVKARVIWASALGDPANFFQYDGVSTDSYAVAVASKGDFTGCIDYSGNPLFFKEDKLYRITGSFPEEYFLYDYDIPGVQNGAFKSMQILNEVLYYKGVEGIYVYSGGQPSLISYRLGLGIYSDATSGSDGRKYYVSMKNMEDKWALFVYDTVVGEWVEEGEEELKDATFIEGRLFLCIGNSVYIADDPASEELVAWEATLPYIEANTLDHKRFRKLRIRGENGSNSVLYVHISAEGIEGEKTVATINTAGRWTKTIPLPAMRTDVLKVRFSGTGEVLVRDMAIEYVLGSDLE